MQALASVLQDRAPVERRVASSSVSFAIGGRDLLDWLTQLSDDALNMKRTLDDVCRKLASFEEADGRPKEFRAIEERCKDMERRLESQSEYRLRAFEESLRESLKSCVGGEAVIREERLNRVESLMAANLDSAVAEESRRFFQMQAANLASFMNSIEMESEKKHTADKKTWNKMFEGEVEKRAGYFEIVEAQWKQEARQLKLSLESAEAQATSAAELSVRTSMQLESHTKNGSTKQAHLAEAMEAVESRHSKSFEVIESRAVSALDLAAKTSRALDAQKSEHAELLRDVAENTMEALASSSSRLQTVESRISARFDDLVAFGVPKQCKRHIEEESALALAHTHSYLEASDEQWTARFRSLEERLALEADRHTRAAMALDCASVAESARQEKALWALRCNTEANEILGQLLEEQSENYVKLMAESRSHSQEADSCVAWETQLRKAEDSLRSFLAIETEIVNRRLDGIEENLCESISTLRCGLEESIQELRTGLQNHSHELQFANLHPPKKALESTAPMAKGSRPFPVGAASSAARTLSVVSPRVT